MSIESKVSVGNIVSWLLVLMALASGWAKLESSTLQNAKDVAAASELAFRVEKAQRDAEAINQGKINTLTTDVAVVKETTKNIEKKLDEFIRFSKGH